MSYEIFYIDKENNKELCFKHAVQGTLIKDKAIETEMIEQEYHFHQCYMCNK